MAACDLCKRRPAELRICRKCLDALGTNPTQEPEQAPQAAYSDKLAHYMRAMKAREREQYERMKQAGYYG